MRLLTVLRGQEDDLVKVFAFRRLTHIFFLSHRGFANVF